MGTENRYDIRSREDRIGKYFRKYLDRFIFVEFSEDFAARSAAGDLMKGVPVPLKKEEVSGFAGGDGVPMPVIAENMAWVMGCDPHFRYTGDYVKILTKLFSRKIYEIMLKEGRNAAERGDMDNACVHFRAVLCLKPDYLDGMYSYARACRAMYLNSENEEYTGRFKAETLECFEMITEVHPKFAQAYYYLGYAYLNIGLYSKTAVTWKKFVRLTFNTKDKKEIKERLAQIEEPVRIEEGYNSVLSGRYDKGIEILEPFLDTRFRTWWPLHYYLGVAFRMTGRRDEAVREFRQALRLNGSQIETMEELAEIYRLEGDRVNADKYSRKIEIVKEAMDQDRMSSMDEIMKEDERLQKTKPDLMDPEVIESVRKWS